MATVTVKLTRARRAGLAVLAAGDRDQAVVRYSNETSTPDADRPSVYWQTANWLVEQGYAVRVPGDEQLLLTAKGRERAREAGL